MTKLNKDAWVGCPTRYAAGILGDRWTLLILRDVLLHGKRHYGAMLDSAEGISTNILADRLSGLERAGMLRRHPDPIKKSRGLYLPTQKAQDFLPALLAMMVWSTQYDTKTEAPPSFAKAFQDDPKATIAWYRAEVAKADATALAGKATMAPNA